MGKRGFRKEMERRCLRVERELKEKKAKSADSDKGKSRTKTFDSLRM